MALTQFRVRTNGFKEIRAKLLIRLIASGGIIVGFSLLIWYLNASAGKDNPYKIFVPAILIAALFAFILTRSMHIQKKLLAGYVLTVENGFIAREQPDTQPIAFSYQDVGSITRTFGGGFLIHCPSTNEIILVPPQIDQQEELGRLLNSIHPVTPQKDSKNWMSLRPYVAPLVIVLLLGIFTADPKWMVVLSGALLAPLMVAGFVTMQRSQLLPKGLQQVSWALIAALGAMIWWVWYRLR